MSGWCRTCRKTLADSEFYPSCKYQCKRCRSKENAIAHCKRMIRRYEQRMAALLAGKPVPKRSTGRAADEPVRDRTGSDADRA